MHNKEILLYQRDQFIIMYFNENIDDLKLKIIYFN